LFSGGPNVNEELVETNMANPSQKPKWQDLYDAVSAETDREKLTELIARVEKAMMKRAEELSHGPIILKNGTRWLRPPKISSLSKRKN
jgi:hypothetical protein